MLLKDFPLHPQLFKAIDKMGFTEATDVQAKTIPEAMAGKDLLVSAQTGSGKTAAFLLPMLDNFLKKQAPNSSTRALILLPTRELAIQTQKTFEKLAAFSYIKCGLIIGGEAFKHQVASLRKNPEVIIATPGRLVEHIEKGTTDFSDLEILVLDEADRMLEMGFAEDMYSIAKCCNEEKQNWLFSATLQHKKMDKVSSLFNNPVSIAIDNKKAHSQISQQIIFADDIKHKEKLVAALIDEEQANKVFIFCNTRAQCQQLGNLLKYKKVKVDFIHGEIAQSERKQILNRFRSGALNVLVATDVAARGLDISDVDLVINFTVAQSGDDHIHRIGRTGRAGNNGKAITLVSDIEYNQMSAIERYLKIRFEQRALKGLKANYKGPKKVKSSGKAAGSKKKINDKKSSKKKPQKKPSAKANKKNTSANSKKTINDGTSPLRRRT